MSDPTTLAEAFPPGEYIKDELTARGWTQEDLAQVLGRPLQAINEIINDKKSITPETAIGLGAAFGTSSEMWLNLQSQWLLYETVETGETGDAARRRAVLRDHLPVNDMVKRGWLPRTKDIDDLEAAAFEFLGVSSFDQDLPFTAAARRSGSELNWTPKQTAWLCRVHSLAGTQDTSSYDRDTALQVIPNLAHMSLVPEEACDIQGRLAHLGIRFVVEAPLPGSRMDGAAFWLNDASPAVAVSIRYDRIDHFWFTLMHELAHILLGHARPDSLPTLDDETVRLNPNHETEANNTAAEWTLAGLSDDELPSRLSDILELAEYRRIHPGLIVGRLHHLHRTTGMGVPYSTHRQTLSKVRHLFETANSPTIGMAQ